MLYFFTYYLGRGLRCLPGPLSMCKTFYQGGCMISQVRNRCQHCTITNKPRHRLNSARNKVQCNSATQIKVPIEVPEYQSQ